MASIPEPGRSAGRSRLCRFPPVCRSDRHAAPPEGGRPLHRLYHRDGKSGYQGHPRTLGCVVDVCHQHGAEHPCWPVSATGCSGLCCRVARAAEAGVPGSRHEGDDPGRRPGSGCARSPTCCPPLLAVGASPHRPPHRKAQGGRGDTACHQPRLARPKLVEALGDGRQFGVEILWSAEESALETAGGIVQALPLLGSEPFWRSTAIPGLMRDYGALQNQPLADDLAHLWLVPNPPQHPRAGIFSLQDGGCWTRQPSPSAALASITRRPLSPALRCPQAGTPAARLDGTRPGRWQPAGWRVAGHRHSRSAAGAG